MKRKSVIGACLVIFMLVLFQSTPVFSNGVDPNHVTNEQVQAAIAGGQRYLLANQVPAEYDGNTHEYLSGGYWQDNMEGSEKLATTAFAVAALLETGVSNSDQQIKDGINYIKQFIHTDGGIYDPASPWHANYQNAVSLIAFSLYGQEDPNIVRNGCQYILNCQNIERTEPTTYPNTDPNNAYYGGWTYRQNSEGEWVSGDLSNTQFATMGLWYASRYLGLPTQGQTWSNALLVYLKRSHGWYDPNNGETWNDQDWVRNPDLNDPNVDGGFSYKPDYESFYPGGSMTGAGIWCLGMIGQAQNPMVELAQTWFARNYSWERNPGSYYDGEQDTAHFYFVYSMAKALTATLGSGKPLGSHNWVLDLKDVMVDPNNGWINIVDPNQVDPKQNYWAGTGDLDGGDKLATSWILMSLAFSDPNTPAIEKMLTEVNDPNFDIPVNSPVILSIDPDCGEGSNALIKSPSRISVGDAFKSDTVLLPIAAFDFTLTNLKPGGTTVLVIEIPHDPNAPENDALDPNNPDGFIDPNGNLKGKPNWYKLIDNTRWTAIADVEIYIDTNAHRIKVTLKDGGPEDTDGNPFNGSIKDPGAPGVDTAEGGGTTGGGGGICFISTLPRASENRGISALPHVSESKGRFLGLF